MTKLFKIDTKTYADKLHSSKLLNKPYFYTLSKSMTEILQLTLVIASFNASIF